MLCMLLHHDTTNRRHTVAKSKLRVRSMCSGLSCVKNPISHGEIPCHLHVPSNLWSHKYSLFLAKHLFCEHHFPLRGKLVKRLKKTSARVRAENDRLWPGFTILFQEIDRPINTNIHQVTKLVS